MLQRGDIVILAAGHYRLCEPLASSAYGLLWRARPQTGIGDVALKLVNRAQMDAAEPSLRAHWGSAAKREIAFLRALAPWDGRHIVRLLDHGTHDGLPALALELLDGDLAAHVLREAAAGRRVGLARTLAWLGQVNAALAKVHQHGWRHLDLKPANLLIDAATGNLKLADFGTNRSLADVAPHSYAGTASWQAPEQFFPDAQGGFLTDARTDYFALGAVFYFLATNGATLGYCGSCADAWREHGRAGAARLRAAGAVPLPTLGEDEAARVAQCALDDGADPAPVLALLRALLAPRREERPSHALAISRMIAAAGARWRRAA